MKSRPGLFQRWSESYRLWLLIAFLAFVFTVGGSVRSDVLPLIVLRPVAVIVCGAAAFTLTREQLSRHRFLFGLALSLGVLIILHLVPLPPAFWHALPGRSRIVEIDQLAGIGDVWRPLTLVPLGTWNAAFALFVPLAVLFLSAQLRSQDRRIVLFAIVVFGAISGLIGLLQATTGPDSPLDFYRQRSVGSAVGLFANRNHQAIFLATLFPMLAILSTAGVETVEQARYRLWAAAAIGIVMVPLLLATGSRAGLVLGIAGLISIPILYRRPSIERAAKRSGKRNVVPFVAGGFAVIGLGLLTALFSRAQALERLVAGDQADDLRFSIWGPIARMGWSYFPFGSGIGSFAEVYQIDEPTALLSTYYTNQAHNDWLDVFMTTGLPGIVILAVTCYAFLRAGFAVWRSRAAPSRDTDYARMASVVLLLIAFGSVGDYPLRVPSLACVAVIMAVWLSDAIAKTPQASTRRI